MKQQRVIFDISTGAIWRIIGIFALLWFLFFIRDILFILLLSIVLVSAILPIVDKAQKRGIPRVVTTMVVYLLFFTLVGLIFYIVVPQILHESKQLATNLPQRMNEIQGIISKAPFSLGEGLTQEGDLTKKISAQVGSFVPQIFSNTLYSLQKVFQIFIVFSLSFYMLIKKNGTEQLVEILTPRKYQTYVLSLVTRIQNKIGRWLLGQMFLMFVIFCLYWVVLIALGIPYATVLALMGGFLELIPYIGAITATIPASLLGLTISPWAGALVILGYILVQQMENHLIVPLVMKKVVGLNPVIIILSLLVGARLGGVIGFILALPLPTAIGVFVGDVLNNRIKVQ